MKLVVAGRNQWENSVVWHIPITQEVEAGGFLRVPGLCGLQREFKVNLACLCITTLSQKERVVHNIVGGWGRIEA